MTEYIEREAAYDDFEKCNSENPKWTPGRVKTLIARQPAADVAQAVHGWWIGTACHGETTLNCFCSVCNTNCGVNYDQAIEEMHFCPNCGARMDKEDT